LAELVAFRKFKNIFDGRLRKKKEEKINFELRKKLSATGLKNKR